MNSSLSWSKVLPAEAAWSLGIPASVSRAAVDYYCGERRDVRRLCGRLFGRVLEDWELTGLAGAPDDAVVVLGTWAGGLYLELEQPQTHAYHGVWLVRAVPRGCLLLNEGLAIHPRRLQGQGVGLRIFERQLRTAQHLGIFQIEVSTQRSALDYGYYAWPRYGCGGPLPSAVLRQLPPPLRGARDVLDLLEAPEGRLWWRQQGSPMQVTFELSRPSRSWRVFERYWSERQGSRSPCGNK